MPTTPPADAPPTAPRQRNRSGLPTKNGSYRHYYSRRHDTLRHDALHPDDRLPLLRRVCECLPTPFTILDIGCNNGTLTTDLASLPFCARAVGIDINPNLIGDARKNLRALAQSRTSAAPALQRPSPRERRSLPLSLPHAAHLGKEPRTRNGVKDNCLLTHLNGDNPFPGNITFRTEDFARPQETKTSQEVEQYDLVLCLSVTKWVHFAWGDHGLHRLFHRIHKCLKPGGVFVLEPQPSKSYKSAIRKGLGKKDVKGERMLRPHQFPAFLKSFAGFGAMKVLRKTREKGHAFNRPIMAFLKGSLDTHALTTRETHHIFAEDPLDGDLGAVNIVGHHVAPLAHVPGIIVPEIVPPVDPVPQNLVPVPANVTPSNATPVSATPASPAPANSIPENAAPADLAVNGAQEDGHDEETENDEGNDGRQAEGSVAIPPENTIQKSIQPVSPEVSSSHLNDTEQRQGNETAREAHAGAASDGNAAPRTSGCKRMRSDEGTDESDERCTKVVKHDTDAAAQ